MVNLARNHNQTLAINLTPAGRIARILPSRRDAGAAERGGLENH